MRSLLLRLKFAFWTLFSILVRNRIPDEVAAALCERESRVPIGTPPGRDREAPREPTAMQLLAVLQRDGRLLDFLMEEIALYPDAQIGAAVRRVHADSRHALQEYLTLEPVLEGEEGVTVTVDANIDSARLKLIGNVAGQPPFAGILRHRGWLVSRIDLPPLSPSAQHVVAPAEVEIL
jgi:hypothetical protein